MQEQSIFIEALEKNDPAERAAFLDEVCAGDPALRERIERLLQRHHQSDSFLESSAPAIIGAVEEPPRADGPGAWPATRTPTVAELLIAECPGTLIGPYKLMEQIGEGGMGLVFVAEQQQPVRRKVALKVIKPGMDTRQVVARFEAERQALALMDHPHIAKVLDGGETASGRPYFVMELVKGTPITNFCDHQQLPVRERLELYLQVCLAVQHAHQKGIIHRDLKPSNVLVTSHDGKPVVRVIDFGVAKAIGQQLTDKTVYTDFAQLIGTPLYMSPEQAGLSGLDIDTRSDLYSLGVLLYELLTGTTPFEKERFSQVGYDEMRRIICEEEPRKPSTRISTLGQAATTVSAQRKSDPKRLSRLVRGELDWIVMTCLEKERDRRYETANGLARDVERYLHDEPVQACPPSAWYRFRKFARRRKRALATATLLGLILLAASAVVLWHDKRWTLQALEAAVQARKKVERSLYFQSIARAHLEWWHNDIGRADHILDECPAEYRHWEWHYLKRLCHADLFTFRGHASAVGCVAFSPDGLRLASASQDKTIRIWDLATGRELLVLPHPEPVNRLAFSPVGQRLAAANGDWGTGRPGAIKIWDAATGQPLLDLTGHTSAVSGVAFSPDGQTLASGSFDGTVKLWDLTTGHEIQTLGGHARAIKCVAFSPDGKRIAAGGYDHTVRIWEQTGGREILTLRGHNADVLSVAYSPDGRWLVSGSWDRTAVVWDVSTGRKLHQLLGHADIVWEAAFSPDGQTVATASADGSVKLWDAAQGREMLALRGHTGTVYSVAFSPGGRCLATAGWDQTVKVWDTTTAPQGRTLVLRSEDMGSNYHTLAFSPDGQLLAAAGRDHTTYRRPRLVQTWETATGQPTPFEVHRPGGFRSLAFSPDGRWLATDWGSAVKVWDVGTSTEVRTLADHAGSVTAVAFSPDGLRLASGSEDQTVKIWDLTTGQVLFTLSGHARGVTSVAFHPGGRHVASASEDGAARIWDATDGLTVRTFTGHASPVKWVAFSPEGRRLASAGEDGTVRIWDTKEGEPVLNLQGHVGPVTSVSYTPDGQRLASASLDGSVRVWDALTGQEALTLRGQARGFWGVAFSPDGRRLAAGAVKQGFITIWDTAEEGPGGRESKVMAWHALEAEGFEARRQWRSALFHRDRLIEAKPQDPCVRKGRGWCYTQLGQWEKAAVDQAKAIELQPDNLELWYVHAPVLLMADDVEGYRQVCGRVFERFGQTKNPRAAYLVARICSLGPEALADLAQPVRLAEQAVAANPKVSLYLHVLGTVHYRAGQFEKAITRLREATEIDPGWSGHACNWLVLAMAHHRLGQADQARQWLDKAVQWIDKTPPKAPKEALGPLRGLPTHDWLAFHVLHCEAEALIKDQPANPARPKEK